MELGQGLLMITDDDAAALCWSPRHPTKVHRAGVYVRCTAFRIVVFVDRNLAWQIAIIK